MICASAVERLEFETTVRTAREKVRSDASVFPHCTYGEFLKAGR